MKYLIFRPENHKIIRPEKEIKIEVPKSGWVITKIVGTIIIVTEINIDEKALVLLVLILWKNFARQRITAIFINSDGWRFKKYKSIHLLDPDAFTPYNETHISKLKIIK